MVGDVRIRLVPPLLAFSILVAACGDDGGDTADPDDPTTTTTESTTTESTTTNAADDSDDDGSAGAEDGDTDGGDDSGTTTTMVNTTTTTEAPGAPVALLAEGSVTTEAGLTATWDLTADTTSLCFTADLSHADPEDEAAATGNSGSACLTPDGGLDDMPGGLSVEVGTVDGDKTIGYLWGRTDANVIRLTIEHGDGSQTNVPLLDGPTDVKVFAFVVDTSTIPDVVALDAVSGEGIEGSAEIRDFLRAGPTYPVVVPATTTAPPDYPTN